MDFEPTEDQVALTDAISSFCNGRFDIETVRGLGDQAGVDRDRWAELAQTGVFSITMDPDSGGVGLELPDAALVFEVLGKAAVPGPLVGSYLAAGHIDGSAEGDCVVGVVEAEARSGIDNSWQIAHLHAVDAILVIASDGVSVIDSPSELAGRDLDQPLDFLTPISAVEALGELRSLGGADLAQDMTLRGTILTAALQVGLSQAATDLAVSYATERHQFGKPIGGFQAIKHLCAEMFSYVEMARAATYAAAVHYAQPDTGDPVRAAAAAKLTASEAGTYCGQGCVHVHGGMGYTWEVDAHLYLKRSWVLDNNFGDFDHHAEVISATL